VTAADLNSDGKPDLATANASTNGASGNTVLINVTEPGEDLPAFDGPTAFNAGETPFSVAAADINGDGRPDLATANDESDDNTVLLNTTPFPFTAGPSSLDFGSQPSGTISASRTITLSNSTAATLPVALRLNGDVDDMLISHSSCGDGVPADGSCTVAIRFAPSAPGPRAATLTLDPAGPQSTQVALTGSGGELPQGPAGATGPTGAPGSTGATGSPGRDARVRCTVAKPRRGSRRTRVTCRVTYPRAHSTTWRLVRAGRVRASGRLRAGTATLRLGRLAPGRYTLRVGGRPAATFRVRRP
jgi:FG-GAP-like repeat